MSGKYTRARLPDGHTTIGQVRLAGLLGWHRLSARRRRPFASRMAVWRRVSAPRACDSSLTNVFTTRHCSSSSTAAATSSAPPISCRITASSDLAVALQECCAQRLAVVGQDHEVVWPRRVLRSAGEAAERAIDAVERIEALGSRRAAVVGDLVIVGVRDVDHGRAAEHLLDDQAA